MTKERLAQMKAVDPRTVDRDTLRDIQSVNIDTSQPKETRIRDYVRQIGKLSPLPAPIFWGWLTYYDNHIIFYPLLDSG